MALIPRDKQLHFAAGLLIYFFVSLISHWFQLNLSSTVVLLCVLLAGIGKEILDMFTDNDVELWDVIATLTGGLFGLLLHSVVNIAQGTS